METLVECKVTSKKETMNYDKEYPIRTTIELEVPYEQNNVFYKLSGGSNFQLNTINQAAADMFKLGDTVEVRIKRKEV